MKELAKLIDSLIPTEEISDTQNNIKQAILKRDAEKDKRIAELEDELASYIRRSLFIPILQVKHSELCQEIEKLPASEQQTKVSILCSELIRNISLTRTEKRIAELVSKNNARILRIAELEEQAEKMKKYKLFFESCSCLFAEGVELMTRTEIYECIKKETKLLEGETEGGKTKGGEMKSDAQKFTELTGGCRHVRTSKYSAICYSALVGHFYSIIERR